MLLGCPPPPSSLLPVPALLCIYKLNFKYIMFSHSYPVNTLSAPGEEFISCEYPSIMRITPCIASGFDINSNI